MYPWDLILITSVSNVPLHLVLILSHCLLICAIFAQIDILNMRLTVGLTLVMTWYEPRVTFKNLKANQQLNFIGVSGGQWWVIVDTDG